MNKSIYFNGIRYKVKGEGIMGFYVQQARFAMVADGIPVENIESVELTAQELTTYVDEATEFKSLLLLGYVQSGKTNGMIMTLAKLIEAGYRYYVVLTGNDNDLYEQTYERIECTNLGVHLVKKEQLNSVNIVELGEDPEKIIVFVVQKYGTYLSRLNNIFEVVDENFIVIDDEADQASLNTNVNNPNANPSTINRYISGLLENNYAKAYIQVTATPYALMLQESEDKFRPQRTFILEPGNGYVGGEELFLNADSSRYHRIYNINDMIFSEDFIIPKALVESTCNFLCAATIKRLSGFAKALSFLVHIDHTQITHENTSHAVGYLITRLHNAIKIYKKNGIETDLILALKREYDELITTCTTDIAFLDIINYLLHSLENVSNQIINSSYNQEISYKRTYTIIVGGNKLSRGITIKNLITTYYCRSTSSPNMDTINQHARMYGYRSEIKDVMRIFTTNQIIEDFSNITRADIDLRNFLRENPDAKLIPINHSNRISATRPTVVPNSALLRFTSRMTTFPHYPIYNDPQVQLDTNIIDSILEGYGTERDGHVVSIDVALRILATIRYNSVSNEQWNSEAIIALLRNKALEIGNQIRVIVRRNSDVSQNVERGLASVLSGTDNEIFDDTLPILFMYRLNGNSNTGWSDKPFWVPIFRMPDTGTNCVTIQCS